jgi:hypothetical protein
MSDDPLLTCTEDIDGDVVAAIRAAWAAERVDIEAARMSQERADAEFEQRLDDHPELVERLAAGDFDVLEAMLEEYDDAAVRPHTDRFQAANQRLVRDHPDLVEKLATRYRDVMSWESGLSDEACLGLWMFKHRAELDAG